MASDVSTPSPVSSPLEIQSPDMRRQTPDVFDHETNETDVGASADHQAHSPAELSSPNSDEEAAGPQVAFDVPDAGRGRGRSDTESTVDSGEMTSSDEPDPSIQGDDDLDLHDDDESGSIYAPSHYPYQPCETHTITSSARSLYDDEINYVHENGRRYCGSYYMPNDEMEQDRMRVMHQVHMHVFGMEQTSVPLKDPTGILDIGTGTGEWPLAMAELFPDCEIIGTDISAIQPSSVPYKVFFELDNAEVEWHRPPDSMDLVHLRDMASAFTDWSFIYHQAHQCLKPGGYIEVLDFYYEEVPDQFMRHFPPTSPLLPLMCDLYTAGEKTGRRAGTGHLVAELFEEAGFTDVEICNYSIPLNPQESTLGKLWLVSVLYGFEAISMRPLTRDMGWTPERVSAACADICEDFQRLAFDPVTGKDFRMSLKVATARKPLVPGQCSAQSVMMSATTAGNGSADEYGGDDSTIDASTIASRSNSISKQGGDAGDEGGARS